MIETLLAFYGFHVLDATTTTWGLSLGAKEGNVLARPFVKSTPRLFTFKFLLASLVLYLSMKDPLGHWLIFGDTLLEGFVTAWNTCVMWEKATGKSLFTRPSKRR
ncbi:DUF5658 family protein [Metallosphaera sedula]|uniref:DUF5658 family protein n=1 Tax=Metallosphaera sedula TaxID=43687 RepID=UPI0020BF2D05|nr:DUF5658 family protein [Metallosphaera sedula]BBL45993.1 hypothetical protein MJ1HA_0080 [Metallosphaera sedula]